MKTQKPLLSAIFAAFLAAPAFAAVERSSAQSIRPLYVADRDDHDRDRRWDRDRDRDRRREEAWEHRRGRDRDRDRDYDRDDRWRGERRVYPDYGYRNDPYYGYGTHGNSSYELGYRDGLATGRTDDLRGYGYNPRRYDRWGDRSYRDGFDAGYNASYGRYR